MTNIALKRLARERLHNALKELSHLLTVALFLFISQIGVGGCELALPARHEIGREDKVPVRCFDAFAVEISLPVAPTLMFDR
ncbi:hypothetical protein GRI40_06250 [Altererythrobacter aerius]|uniref:Uncharacterized protein n=1 Tax=Tsuneonella aeria TaxID=1837929 RepID=A0A6I4TF91_9SPHN|nr:hypothetical protein [Tsuneonella aeria]MXO74820.1 hypothetical protein [Tsuneonella aeria]